VRVRACVRTCACAESNVFVVPAIRTYIIIIIIIILYYSVYNIIYGIFVEKKNFYIIYILYFIL